MLGDSNKSSLFLFFLVLSFPSLRRGFAAASTATDAQAHGLAPVLFSSASTNFEQAKVLSVEALRGATLPSTAAEIPPAVHRSASSSSLLKAPSHLCGVYTYSRSQESLEASRLSARRCGCRFRALKREVSGGSAGEEEVLGIGFTSVGERGASFLIESLQFNIQRLSFEEDHEVETLDEAKAALQKIINKPCSSRSHGRA